MLLMKMIRLFFNLSYTKRIFVFVMLLITGIFFCLISTWLIFSPKNFAKFYTIGCICIIVSTFFLVGPKKQLQSMFHPSRLLAAVIYFGSMMCTLFVALKLQWTSLTIIMIVIQFGSAVWYGASYIPMGQSCLRSTAKTVLPI